ncbi:hypothetical protein T484DRAFT_1817479 [Baffinella frigidus]|nr:hypothetical protein T484DRAFT_1817479 [Cryptophyta sp. CCMP2293]
MAVPSSLLALFPLALLAMASSSLAPTFLTSFPALRQHNESLRVPLPLLRGGNPDLPSNNDTDIHVLSAGRAPPPVKREHSFYTTAYLHPTPDLNNSTFQYDPAHGTPIPFQHCPPVGMGNEYTDEYWANRERDLADAEDNDNHGEQEVGLLRP